MTLRNIRITAIQAAVVILVLGADAGAQIMSRSLLQTNFGNDGHDFDAYWAIRGKLAYPRYLAAGHPGDSGRITSGSGYFTDNSQGHGIYILTRQDGELQTVWTGPRDLPPDFGQVHGMQYNPGEGSEAHLGTEHFPRDGTNHVVGNWYPGRVPFDPNSPVGINIANHRFWDYTADDNFPEQIIVNKWTTSQGITFVRKAYGYSFPDFDDFIVIKLEFTNTGDTNGNGVRDLPEEAIDPLYVSTAQWFNPNEYEEFYPGWGTHWRAGPRYADNWLAYSDAPNYPTDRYGREGKTVPPGLKLLYAYDDDNPTTPYDDRGGPMWFDVIASSNIVRRRVLVDGQLMAYQVIGVAPIAYTNQPGDFAFAGEDAGKNYVEPDGDQPSSVRWLELNAPNHTDPNPSLHNPQQMQDILMGGIQENPTEIGQHWTALTFGPYALAPGESGMIVFAYVAGAGSQIKGEDMATWALKGNQDELSLGVDAIVQNLLAARFAYKNGWDVPDAPPDTGFETSITPDAHLQITWSAQIDNAVNPDTSMPDITGYEIFRSEWLPFGPWEQIATVSAGSASGGEYVYVDNESVAGFTYRYTVRAVAEGHPDWTNGKSTVADLPAHIQESVKSGLKGGRWAPFQKEWGDKSPKVPGTQALDALQEKVKVVPNPFILEADSPHRYPGQIDRLRFTNIPRKCNIYIYTLSGDLVDIIEHDDSLLAEAEWQTKTINYITQAASGIYYYAVESLVPGSEGTIQTGTFYIIR